MAEQNVSLEFHKFKFGWFNISYSNAEGCIYHLEPHRAKKSAWNIFILGEILFLVAGGEEQRWEGHQSEDKTISLTYKSQTHGN